MPPPCRFGSASPPALRGGSTFPAVRLLLAGLVATIPLAGCRAPKKPAPHPPSPVAVAARPDDLFEDVTEKTGIRFRLGHGGRTPLTILDTAGCGAGWIDYDRDGYPDLVLISEKEIALYHNLKGERFEDVTHQAGLTSPAGEERRWMGCAVADYDRDGYPDLYVSGYRGSLLFRNTGKGRFVERAQAAGVRNTGAWETSAGFADLNGDGRPDLYVARYLTFTATSRQLCEEQGVAVACPPSWYPAEKGKLYLGRGDGTFRDATGDTGVGETPGRGLGIAFQDFDANGRTDLYVANDNIACDLFRNRGRFENIGVESGTAYSDTGVPQAGMGTDWGDFDGDGRPDLVVATFQREGFSLFRNAGGGTFQPVAAETGLYTLTLRRLGFGAKFLDFDNDGDLDLAFANGHVQDQAHRIDSTAAYAQPALLVENTGENQWRDVTERAGPGFRNPAVGRGLAAADFDRDGDEDLVLVDAEGSPRLLRNRIGTKHHWLRVRLEGSQSNREGLGAVVRVTAAGRTLRRECTTSGSYLSAHEPVVHFGLGAASGVQRLEVSWPSGKRSQVKTVAIDREIVVREAS